MNASTWSSIGRRTFIVATTAAPFLVTVLLELQIQLRDREFDWWTLGEVATGAIMSLVIAVFHVQRQATERIERTLEAATNTDVDSDQHVEQPE